MQTSHLVLALMTLSAVGIASCSSDEKNTPRTGASSSASSSSGPGASSSSSGDMSSSSGGMGGNGSGGGGPGGNGTGGMSGHCSNGFKDADETQIDCGGADCLQCIGEACMQPADCISLNCANNKCLPPSCSDKVKNGTETDIDCGGPDCPDCDDGANCNVAEDCQSKICNNGLCYPATCTDNVHNGVETGIDCGGPVCPRCLPGADCKVDNDCNTKFCPVQTQKCTCPNNMVTASTKGNVTYCIDQVEVTNQAYEAFVNTPNIPPQDAFCSWNTTYVPNGGFAPAGKNLAPVVNVDWCDAYAFCRVQGKHLCGGLGFTSADFNSFTNPDVSIWYNACSGQGASVYPYGNNYKSMTCNDQNPGGDVIDVLNTQLTPIITVCAGNFPSLYNMSGNAAEWEDSCNGQNSANDLCRIRGGSFASMAADVSCSADVSMVRSTTSNTIGFRCCL